MKFYQKHKRLSMALTFAFFIFTGACGFPIYNLSREWSTMLPISIVLLGVSLYSSIGASEAVMFPNCKLCHILLLNLLLVLLSMGSRYLLEFGEVSNTYNFTLPNMILHILVTVTLSTLSWVWTVSKQLPTE